MGQSKTPSDAWTVVERQPRTPAALEPACRLAWPLRLPERALSAPQRAEELAHLCRVFRPLGHPPERMTLQGFRAMTRTIRDEALGFRPNFIEHEPVHSVRDPDGRAYNRTAFAQAAPHDAGMGRLPGPAQGG